MTAFLRYILDKLSIQAGLETQKQLSTKLEDANNRIKSLEDEIEQLKATTQKPPEEEVKEEPKKEGEEAPPDEEVPPPETE